MKKYCFFLILLVLFSCLEKESNTNLSEKILIRKDSLFLKNPAIGKIVINPKNKSAVYGEIFIRIEKKICYMSGNISGLTPGKTHAVHIHDKGDCSSDCGTSAGGHWNPLGQKHGKWNEKTKEGYHLGDVGNIKADTNGIAIINFKTANWSFNDNSNLDILGKSIIIHADADDLVSQPSGNAGKRIGCGVIKLIANK